MNKEEFDKEFGNVEKTIKMPKPPTWEEFKKIKKPCWDCLNIQLFRNSFGNLELKTNNSLKIFDFTKDGYIMALNKMKELWLEEV